MAVPQHEYEVHLSIDAEAYRRYYSGAARVIVARDAQGRRVQFPAERLRTFVTHQGIQGTFVLRVDEDNRLLEIRRKAG